MGIRKMILFLKRVIPYILYIGMGSSLMSCSLFSGLLYPKVVFSLKPVGVQIPDNAEERLREGAAYPQVFTFFFSQAGNSFKTYFVPTIFVDKSYESLYVKELKYEFENTRGVFLKDKTFKIPVNRYVNQNGWYWLRGIGRDGFFKVNFENIFTEMNPGSDFLFNLEITYSFDNGPEKTQTLEYKVTALKGKYISPFMGR